MKESKLLYLLQALPPSEFRKLGKMVRSPFFTNNAHLQELYRALKPYYPEFESDKLDKELVFQKLFADRKYSDIKMRNLMRDLTRLVEDLLIYQRMQEEPYERKKQLLEVYDRLQVKELFQTEAKALHTLLKKESFRDSKYYHQQLDLFQLELQSMESVDLEKRIQLLMDSDRSLELFYQLEKVKLKAERLGLSSLFTIPEQEELPLEQNIIWRVYTNIIQLYTGGDASILEETKEMLFTHLDYFRLAEKQDLLVFLINYSVRKMRENDQVYNAVVFELYKEGLKNGILIRDGHISDNAFLNIVVTGSKERQFDWVKRFIKQNEQFLSEASKEDITALGRSYLFFNQRKFKDAIELLYQHDFRAHLQQLSARVHIIRCYYELFLSEDSYLDLFISQTLAFEKWIRRNNKLSANKKKAYLNFSSFLRQLSEERSVGPLDKALQERFSDRLKQQEVTMSRSWLLEKIKG